VIDPALPSDALATMMGARMSTHGNPMETLSKVAAMWGGYLGREIGVADVGAMMVMLKLARAGHSYDRDHYLDAIAYAALAEDAARP